MHGVLGMEACSQICVFSECSTKTVMSLLISVLCSSVSFLSGISPVWGLERFYVQLEVLLIMEVDKTQD